MVGSEKTMNPLFIRNQLTQEELEQLRAAWWRSEAAGRRYDFAPAKHQTEALASAAREAERQLHALWRSHGWADQPTREIGFLMKNEGIV